jgi:DNA-binding CsgD family transcriptional regulator
LTEGISLADGGIATGPLLEREGELAQLGAALSRARNGGGRVVLVRGPAGIGKTRLLAETTDRARAIGLDVLTARGGELESGYGFGVVRQLLESSVAQARRDELSELLSGAAALAESVFSVSVSGRVAATQTVLHGLYWLVANLAERSPLLLAIDDVQWADGPSLRFMLYLARRLEGMPVALVLVLRTGEAGADDDVIRALALEAHPPVLEPGALSRRATRALTMAGLGHDVSEDLERSCHDATRGNPFLLVELLHQLRERGEDNDPATVGAVTSERLAAAILLRIGRVHPSAPALARAVSVLGESAHPETAAALAAVDPTGAGEVADALARAEILERERPLRFVHPLVRTAVYEDMPTSARARLHALAARLLRDKDCAADAVAMHLLLTDPPGDPGDVEILREAARSAMARGAPETAVDLLRRAQREPLTEANRAALLLELGTAASRAGHTDAVQLLHEAFALAREQPGRAIAGLELASALGFSSTQSPEAIPVLEAARLDLEDDRLESLLDASLVTFAICVPGARSRASAALGRARRAICRPASPNLLALLSPLSIDLGFDGASADEVSQLAERALAGGQLMRQDIATDAAFALGAVWALISTGRLTAAKQACDDGISYGRDRGARLAVARIAGTRAVVHWRLGDLSMAESDAQTALSVEGAWGIPHAASSAVLAFVMIEHGDLDRAHEALAAIDPDPGVLEVTPNQIVRDARATLLLAGGRPREALIELLEHARWEQQSGLGSSLGPVAWRSRAALAHLALGEVGEARDLAAQELQLARAFGAAPQLGTALRVLGIVEGGTRGLTLLEEAVAVLERSPARLDHARALVDHGALLRRCGERKAAAGRLRAGMDLAHRCGATALVEAAAAELRHAGARPRRIAVTGRDSLTPSERRVTELAAEGLTNKQIAQALFVTLRTVEMHLSNSYRKLDITSREQLASALTAE